MKIKCIHCGGQFEDTEAKCPYCDSIYERGAEKKYREKLENIRKDLDVVDDMAEESYKADLRVFFKTFFRVSIAMSVAVFIGYLVYTASVTGKISVERSEAVNMMNEIADFHKKALVWNAYYDSGDYETMYEVVKADKKEYSNQVSRWNHYDFYHAYEKYEDAKKDYEKYVNAPITHNSALISALHSMNVFYYNLNRDSYSGLKEKEKVYLSTKYDELLEEFCETAEISMEDYVAVREEACKNGYPEYKVSQAFVDERFGD